MAKSDQQSLVSILSKNCHIQYDDAKINEHFFLVKLENLIGEGERLLEHNYIYNCLSQIAPVDFCLNEFTFGPEIKEALAQSEDVCI